MNTIDPLDDDARYRSVCSRDRRYDGVFYTAVRSTGIYCRPSCPARTPTRRNVTFYRSPAAAQAAGFRACLRCLPDATPGSPEWDLDADAANRAMRLISDGIIEREGVPGLARALGFSERQLNRLVTGHWGAGPLALARARRAQTARVLIETTRLPMTDIAFAAGFASVRQFNDTVREVYSITPRELRGRSRSGGATDGWVSVRVAVREPFFVEGMLAHLALHAVEGVEHIEGATYTRSLRLPHGPGVVRVDLEHRSAGAVPAHLRLADLRDLAPALERVRRMLDADADPVAIDGALSSSQVLAQLVAVRPGLRVPGHPDGAELLARAIVGQQVSLAGARRTQAALTELAGEAIDPVGPVRRLFPSAQALAALDPETLPMPRSRGRALVSAMGCVASGEVRLDRSSSRHEVAHRLSQIKGVGPWTTGYVAMRALGDPDVVLPTDAVARRAAATLGIDLADTSRWAPWRSYLTQHLWAHALTRGEET